MTLSSTATAIIRRHATAIAQLPDPRGDSPWFWAREYGLSSSLAQKMHQREMLDRKRLNDIEVRKWRVDPAVYDHAQTVVSNSVTLPCNHAGVRNVPNGGYECSRCGAPCTREDAVAVLSQSLRADGGEE